MATGPLNSSSFATASSNNAKSDYQADLKTLADTLKSDSPSQAAVAKALGQVEIDQSKIDGSQKFSDFSDTLKKDLGKKGVTDFTTVESLLGQETSSNSNDTTMKDFVSKYLGDFLSATAPTTGDVPAGLVGDASAGAPAGGKQTATQSTVTAGDYTVTFNHSTDSNTGLSIKDKNGKDITPAAAKTGIKPGYTVLPDGSAVYVKSTGKNGQAFLLKNGSSYEITNQNDAKLTQGQATRDFLNGSLPTRDSVASAGTASDASTASSNYLSGYVPAAATDKASGKSDERVSLTPGVDPAADGALPSDINSLAALASQQLAGIDKKYLSGNDDTTLRDIIQNGDVSTDTSPSNLDDEIANVASAHNKAQTAGDTVAQDKCDALTKTLQGMKTAYQSGQRMTQTPGDGAPDPAKSPEQWQSWALTQNVASINENAGAGGLRSAALGDVYTSPGKGVAVVHTGDADSAEFVSSFTSKDDVKNFLQKSSDAGDGKSNPFDATAALKSQYNVYAIPGANTTILADKKTGVLQAFDTDTGAMQNMPPFTQKAPVNGTMIFSDGTRLDVKDNDGLTFLSGNQLTTTKDPSAPGHEQPADVVGSGGDDTKTWTTFSPAAMTRYVGTNSVNPNNVAVDVKHPNDDKRGWAWSNNTSKDGTTAWTRTGSGNQGTVGDGDLAYLNDPTSTNNSAVTRALYSLDPTQTSVFGAKDPTQGWSPDQLGHADTSNKGEVANYLSKYGVQIGLTAVSVAALWIPGIGEGVAAADAAEIGALDDAGLGIVEGAAEAAAAPASTQAATGAAAATGDTGVLTGGSVTAAADDGLAGATAADPATYAGSVNGSDDAANAFRTADQISGKAPKTAVKDPADPASYPPENLSASDATSVASKKSSIEQGFTNFRDLMTKIADAGGTTGGKSVTTGLSIAGTGGDTSDTDIGHIIGLVAGVADLASGVAELSAREGVEMINALTDAAHKPPVNTALTIATQGICKKINQALESKGFGAIQTTASGVSVTGSASQTDAGGTFNEDAGYLTASVDGTSIATSLIHWAAGL